MNLKLKSLVLSAASIAASTVVATKDDVRAAADGTPGLPYQAVVSADLPFAEKVIYKSNNVQEIAAYLIQNSDAFALTESERALLGRYRVLLAEQGGLTKKQASDLLKHFQEPKCLGKRLADVAAKAVIPATGAAAVVAAVLGFHAPSRAAAKMVVKSVGAALANPTSPLAAVKAQATDYAFETTMAATLVGPNSLFAKEVKKVTALYDALEKAKRDLAAKTKALTDLKAKAPAGDAAQTVRDAHAKSEEKADEAVKAADKVKTEAEAQVTKAEASLFREFDMTGILSSLVNSGIASRGLTYEELHAKVNVLFAAERARIADLKKKYDDAKKAADKVQEESAKKIEAANKKCDELVAKAANEQAKEVAQKARDTEVARINHEIELKKLEIAKLEALSRLAEAYAEEYTIDGHLFDSVLRWLNSARVERMALDSASAARGLNLSVDPAVVNGFAGVVRGMQQTAVAMNADAVRAQVEVAQANARVQVDAAREAAVRQTEIAQLQVNHAAAARIVADERDAAQRAIAAERDAAQRAIAAERERAADEVADAQRRAAAAIEATRRDAAAQVAAAQERSAAAQVAAARAQGSGVSGSGQG